MSQILAELSRSSILIEPYPSYFMVMARVMFCVRDVAQCQLVGAYDVVQLARTTLCFRNRSFVISFVLNMCSNTHLKYSKWKEKALNCLSTYQLL